MKSESMLGRCAVACACALVPLTAACSPKDTTVTQPIALSESNPVKYPLALWDQRIEGETVLLVHVDERGAVDSTRIEKESGHVAFDSAASAGARLMRFTPGKRGDRYVAMWTRMPIRFSMDSAASVAVPVPMDSMK